MNSFTLAARRMFRPGEHTISKLLTLSLGFSVSLLLLSIVFFQRSYERDYPDYERICLVKEQATYEMSKPSKTKMMDFGQTSGAVAPGIEAEIPEVEEAVRITHYGDLMFMTEDRKLISGMSFCAEPDFLKMFGICLLAGNPDKVLQERTKCLVSESMARKLGGNVVGKKLEKAYSPGSFFEIEGIFRDLPKNSRLKMDVLVPMSLMSEESLNNWVGNDRYQTYVKLRSGVKPDDLKTPLREMQKRHHDLQVFKDSDFDLRYTLTPISELRLEEKTVRSMLYIQEIVGIAVLIIALLNYVLMTLASMVNRRKGAAIRKCYGANAGQIQGMMIWETFIYLFVSLAVAVLLLAVCRTPLEQLVEVPLLHLISWRLAVLLTVLLVVATFFMGWIPGWILSKTPVMNIFRRAVAHNRAWKLGLLAVEFAAATFLFAMLAITGLQYRHMVVRDAGYNPQGVYYASLTTLEPAKLKTAIAELEQMPEFEGYSFSSVRLSARGQSGDSFMEELPSGGNRELINVADLFCVDERYLDLYGIRILEGHKFDADSHNEKECLVSESTAKEIARKMNWSDGVVDKQVLLSSFGSITIRGVYDDLILRREHISVYPEKIPSTMVYGDVSLGLEDNIWFSYLNVRFNHTNDDVMRRANSILSRADRYESAEFTNVELELLSLFDAAKNFRNTIFFGAIVAILIALIGLIGYVNTEVNRRRKELAIRKINGAEPRDIHRLFIADILRICVPSVLAGLVIAYIFSSGWLEKFGYRITLTPLPFLVVGIVVLLIVVGAVLYNVRRLIHQNPIESIKYE